MLLQYKSKNNVIEQIFIRMYRAHNGLMFVHIHSVVGMQLFHSLLLNLLPLRGVIKLNLMVFLENVVHIRLIQSPFEVKSYELIFVSCSFVVPTAHQLSYSGYFYRNVSYC